MGRIGAYVIAQYPEDWKERLERLATLDWSRTNLGLWEGRAMVNGRVSRAKSNIMLTGNVMKKVMGLPLTPDEKRFEEGHRALVAIQANEHVPTDTRAGR